MLGRYKETLPLQEQAFALQKEILGEKHVILCEENGETIGVLNLRYEEQLHHSETIAEIMEFVIATGYRKEGRGKDMLAYASQHAKEKGCTQIEVSCNQLRKDTHRFY